MEAASLTGDAMGGGTTHTCSMTRGYYTRGQTEPFAMSCLTVNVSRTDVLPFVKFPSIAESAYRTGVAPTALPSKICHQEAGGKHSTSPMSDANDGECLCSQMLDCPED